MNKRAARLPDFVILGEQKCGTGWLRDRLREHPDVFAYPAEINFFNRKKLYAKSLHWYASHFARGSSYRICGEKSAAYFWFDAPSEGRNDHIDMLLQRDLPNARFIVSLRHPVDRALSAINHHLRKRRVHPGDARRMEFGELLTSYPQRFEEYGIVERGYYHNRLARSLERFGQNMLVLIFERDVVEEPAAGIRKVCRHLGIDANAGHFTLHHNRKARKLSYPATVAQYHLPFLRHVIRKLDVGRPFGVHMSSETRQRLVDLYLRDVERTERLLGVSLDIWKR